MRNKKWLAISAAVALAMGSAAFGTDGGASSGGGSSGSSGNSSSSSSGGNSSGGSNASSGNSSSGNASNSNNSSGNNANNSNQGSTAGTAKGDANTGSAGAIGGTGGASPQQSDQNNDTTGQTNNSGVGGQGSSSTADEQSRGEPDEFEQERQNDAAVAGGEQNRDASATPDARRTTEEAEARTNEPSERELDNDSNIASNADNSPERRAEREARREAQRDANENSTLTDRNGDGVIDANDRVESDGTLTDANDNSQNVDRNNDGIIDDNDRIVDNNGAVRDGNDRYDGDTYVGERGGPVVTSGDNDGEPGTFRRDGLTTDSEGARTASDRQNGVTRSDRTADPRAAEANQELTDAKRQYEETRQATIQDLLKNNEDYKVLAQQKADLEAQQSTLTSDPEANSTEIEAGALRLMEINKQMTAIEQEVMPTDARQNLEDTSSRVRTMDEQK